MSTVATSGNSSGIPRLVYWLSLLLLIIGGRALIDPSHRQTGETVHVYITLVAFELYIWLLLMLGRWQRRLGWNSDVARSGLFALVLQGLMFLAVTELNIAAQVNNASAVSNAAQVDTVNPAEGLVACILVVVLAVAKLLLSPRWLRYRLPVPLAGLSVAWIVLMGATSYLLSWLTPGYPTQVGAAFLLCWAGAILASAHVVLAAWWRLDASCDNAGLLPWWSAWLVSGGLGAMTILQFYATRWGLFVDFPLAFFAPMVVAGAVALLTLTSSCGQRRLLGWLVLVVASLAIVIAAQERVNVDLPAWLKWNHRLLMHPVYPPAILGALLAGAAGLKLRYRPLMALGGGVLVAGVLAQLIALYGHAAAAGTRKGVDGLGETVADIMKWRHAQGVLLLIGAFGLLGLGVLMQWAIARRQRNEPHPPPVPQEVKPDSPPARVELAELFDPTKRPPLQ